MAWSFRIELRGRPSPSSLAPRSFVIVLYDAISGDATVLYRCYCYSCCSCYCCNRVVTVVGSADAIGTTAANDSAAAAVVLLVVLEVVLQLAILILVV